MESDRLSKGRPAWLIMSFIPSPVTEDQTTGFTWNTGTINFNTGTDWAAVTFFNTLTIAGSVTTGIVPTTGDNVGLIAGEISSVLYSASTQQRPSQRETIHQFEYLLCRCSAEFRQH